MVDMPQNTNKPGQSTYFIIIIIIIIIIICLTQRYRFEYSDLMLTMSKNIYFTHRLVLRRYYHSEPECI